MEGGKLSTRKGNVIYAEQILHEAIEKIHEIINEKNPDLPNKIQPKTAREENRYPIFVASEQGLDASA